VLESTLEKQLIARRKLVAWSAIFSVLLVLGGCGPGKPVWERTIPVSGTITYKGKPISDAE